MSFSSGGKGGRPRGMGEGASHQRKLGVSNKIARKEDGRRPCELLFVGLSQDLPRSNCGGLGEERGRLAAKRRCSLRIEPLLLGSMAAPGPLSPPH